jgi:hypothetical protein
MRQVRVVFLLMTLLSTMAMAQSVEGRRAVYFNKINVCPAGQKSPKPCSLTRKLTYSVTATTTFGKTRVVTQGTPNLDFTLSGTTCRGTLAAGSSCTVHATFAPLAPGVRMGAVQLTDSSGNLLATTLLNGLGQGPVAAFAPGAQITVPVSGILDGGAVAVDAAGDVFVHTGDHIVKIAARTGVQTTVASGVAGGVGGLAVDGAGNIFASERKNAVVVKIAAGTGVQTTVGEGLSGPWGVAVDRWGNVFIADGDNSRVVEVHAATGIQSTVLHAFIGGIQFLYLPVGVAVDGAGDVFITDPDNTTVWEVPAGGLNGGYPILVAEAVCPTGVAVDAAGDVFFADPCSNQVNEVPAGGGPKSIVAGIPSPWALAVDGAGDVFVGDNNGNLVEVKGSQPSTLNFGKIAVGSTSSPQSVTIQNVGNQPLNAVPPGLSIGTYFLQVPGSGTPADCTGTFSLTPGATCGLSVVFQPQVVGTIKGTATFTDNALNTIPFASQNVKLKGAGVQ